ncbi:hypothetical protein [Pedobacter puniceum]|uniref:Uncharacterized protein n=1 Tax=Pedobacter puniceum TaxID=2666136 RepID=A0A7K0FRT6_9SPHI|nr:hypothetical protein [Pedobacter puniceum]MRX48473.1 hypothetical protein [Pedobacter puniceum]
MEYFRMTYSTGKEIGRDFPQLHCLTQIYAHQLSAWEFPSFVPKLEFELNKTAKLTDVLSNAAISGFGLLMNDKMKETLSKFNLMKHKFYDAKIIIPKTGEEIPFNYFHPCDPDLSRLLDYDKSVFYETKWTSRVDIIRINSYDHYKELKSQDKKAMFGVKLDEIYVNNLFDKTLDLFVFLPFANSTYVTKRLKDELEKNNIKGLTFEDAPEIKV